jgi:hypothetical protein
MHAMKIISEDHIEDPDNTARRAFFLVDEGSSQNTDVKQHAEDGGALASSDAGLD